VLFVELVFPSEIFFFSSFVCFLPFGHPTFMTGKANRNLLMLFLPHYLFLIEKHEYNSADYEKPVNQKGEGEKNKSNQRKDYNLYIDLFFHFLIFLSTPRTIKNMKIKLPVTKQRITFV
jgi:hypothetical protein